ncbi:MAG: hypothetical protein IPG04_14670 [Polyangiaceae bacterium]|nr:hypothetical protein [Polyangiaceae bacterium]
MNAAELVEALADLLADRIAAKLGATATPDYFDRDHLPPGAASWRAVLEAGRRGDLEVTRVGRKAVVSSDAWTRYLEARRGRSSCSPKARPEIADADARALAELGVVVPMRAAGGRR